MSCVRLLIWNGNDDDDYYYYYKNRAIIILKYIKKCWDDPTNILKIIRTIIGDIFQKVIFELVHWCYSPK